MDAQRERLIGRHNRVSTTAGNCRSVIGFSIMVCVTISLVIAGLILTGQAKTSSEILSLHSGQCSDLLNTQIIAHRGSSGMMPAHSVEGYELAAEQGADFIECDLAMTKDEQLVCLHDAFLTSVTNIKHVRKFADRKRTLTYKDIEIDDWWVMDFTVEELKELTLNQEHEDRDQSYNGMFKIPTFEEYLQVAIDKKVKIYPESKTPSFFNETFGFFMEDLFLKTLKSFNFDETNTIIQSFDPESLKRVKIIDENYPLIILTKRDLTDEELDLFAKMGGFGIGARKSLVVTAEDNKRTGYSDLVERAHSRGLKVHIWVCRNEPEYLLWDYGLDPYREYEDLIKISKVDGIFTDFPWSLKNYMEMTDLNCS